MTDLAEGAASATYLAAWCEPSDLSAARLAGVTDVDRELACLYASALLYRLSGRAYRSGRTIGRPTQIDSPYGSQNYLYPYSSMSGYGAAWGYAAGWAWTQIGMGWWQGGMDRTRITLQGRIRKINEIMVDGESLGSWSPEQGNTYYAVFDRREVVRLAAQAGVSSGAWPWAQQLELPISEPGTWLIDYDWGVSVPADGKMAAIILAQEVALSMTGSDETALSPRILSIASQGVQIAVGDPMESINLSRTGLPVVDMWLQSVNPGGKRRRRAVILSPNTVQVREQSTYGS